MSRSARSASLAVVAFVGGGCGAPSPRQVKTPAPRVVTGVQLEARIPQVVRRACRQAQREVRVRVACPAWVPQGPFVRYEGLWGGYAFGRTLWVITFNNGDNSARYLHWMMGAGRRSAVRRYLFTDAVNDVKGMPRRLARETIRGREVLTYRYPPHPAGGPSGGHVAVYVACGPDYVFGSVHGYDRGAVSRALALAYADQLECPS